MTLFFFTKTDITKQTEMISNKTKIIMKQEDSNQQLSVACGNTTDSFEMLEQLCKKKAEQLSRKLVFGSVSTIKVPFWTENFPELICVGTFTKQENGEITYNLDFSQSTL